MAATTPASRKAKGRVFQQEVRQKLLETFPDLHPDNIKVSIMGEAGVDIILSPLARERIPYSVECKRQEKLNIWDALKQAEDNKTPNTEAIVVFRRNKGEAHVMMKFEHFLKLIASPLDKPAPSS